MEKPEKLIDIGGYPVGMVLDGLLADKSTKRNIIWATDTYEEYGEGFTDKVQMDAECLLMRPELIRPRIQKSLEAQAQRTRKKAEVFTPAWLCNRMNNTLDEDWFRRTGIFNTENEDHTWTVTEGKIEFPEGRTWQQYVDSRRLEITCGEAPYLVSRYDVSTGKLIFPTNQRIGLLDRKLRIVNENTESYEEWLKWTLRGFESTYGYEYQGDNVLIARINLLMTFFEYYEERWNDFPGDQLARQVVNRIVWNIWQMDGLKDTVPLGKPYEEHHQITLFDLLGTENDEEDQPEAVPCRIFNWRSNASAKFMGLKESQDMGRKLFDYVIGNPPYQEDYEGESSGANSVYHKFMDATFEVSDHVELIIPGRFLFNAGSTPKAWNAKMLSDPHFKVLHYESVAANVFPNVIITGGVAITYRDADRDFGAIETYTAFEPLNTVLKKIRADKSFISLSDIAVTSFAYHFTDIMHNEHPEAKELMSKGHAYDLKSNCFKTLSQIFTTEKQQDSDACILGRDDSGRVLRYIKREYINDVSNFDKYKVFLSKADGASGTIGNPIPARIVGTSVIGYPQMGSTESFLSIGNFATLVEAENLTKYIKTKFARATLGILKVTQDITPSKWKFVPLQDFTPSSDIDWSKSIHEIDLQLYRKYGLSVEEIEFIETHVKEMA